MPATLPNPRTSAPLTAIELDLQLDEWLAFLARFRDPALVVRSGGLTWYQKTRFGSFRRLAAPTSLPLRDELSGLEVNPTAFARICLVQGSGLPPSFEIECAGSGFTLAIWPGNNLPDSALLRELVASVDGRPLAHETMRREGASAWLDELDLPCPRFEGQLVFDREAGTLSVAVRSTAFALKSSFRPRVIDRDGETLRLSDAEGRRVLHVLADRSPAPFSSSTTSHHFRP